MGLHCHAKPYLSLSRCKKQQDWSNGTSIHNVSLSTVVRCEEGLCSANLNVVLKMTLHDVIRGVFMCVHSAGMLERCKIANFLHNTRQHATEKEVEVQYDCFSVRPGQDLLVTLNTVPSFCDNTWTQKYTVPECADEDLRRTVSECKTGELEYTVNTDRTEITVRVREAPEDADYNLRLCLKGRICIGVGSHRLIKKQDLHRNQSFLYSKALPCLCIEGWPATMNARRTQVCPFKSNMEELWSGVIYDHHTQALSWKPACPVKAVISLCQAVAPKTCLDFGNTSLSSEKHNVVFSTVDPHPQLCMKFTTEAGFWIECPFSSERFPGWNLKVASKADGHLVEIMSWSPARFAVGLCKMSTSVTCELLEESSFLNISVDRTKPAVVSLSAGMCDPNVCIQVKRTDVQFAIQEHRCNLQCSDQQFDQWSYSEALKKYALPIVVFIITLVMVVLIGNVTLKACGWGQRKQKPEEKLLM